MTVLPDGGPQVPETAPRPIAKQTVRVTMPALVDFGVGDKLLFTPGIQAKAGDNFEFRNLIAKYDEQVCFVIELPEVEEEERRRIAQQVNAISSRTPEDKLGEAAGNLFVAMRSPLYSPRATVRFADGFEKLLQLRHFTALPK